MHANNNAMLQRSPRLWLLLLRLYNLLIDVEEAPYRRLADVDVMVYSADVFVSGCQ